MLPSGSVEAATAVTHAGETPWTMTLNQALAWFTGGTRHPYMTLVHCMSHDTFWIALTVTLDLLVAAGYVVIARHWWRNQRLIPPSPAKAALGSMKNIFILCGICGYLFIPVKMVWPAWRLYDGFLCVLVVLTWRYALRVARALRSSIKRSGATRGSRSTWKRPERKGVGSATS